MSDIIPNRANNYNLYDVSCYNTKLFFSLSSEQRNNTKTNAWLNVSCSYAEYALLKKEI